MEPGYYWFREHGADDGQIAWVEGGSAYYVVSYKPGGVPESMEHAPINELRAEWSGPLPDPFDAFEATETHEILTRLDRRITQLEQWQNTVTAADPEATDDFLKGLMSGGSLLGRKEGR